MRRNPDFLLQEVAGTWVVIPVGAATAGFSGMINLNSTGAFLWDKLGSEQTLESLTEALTGEYEVDPAQAREDVERFLDRLKPTGAIL